MDLPMEVRQIVANKNIKDDIGKVALQRGPLIYCAEWADNFGKAGNIIVPPAANFSTMYEPALLHGVVTLKSSLPAVIISNDAVSTTTQAFTGIPYYAWAHRGKGEMMIWFPAQVKNIDLISHD